MGYIMDEIITLAWVQKKKLNFLGRHWYLDKKILNCSWKTTNLVESVFFSLYTYTIVNINI